MRYKVDKKSNNNNSINTKINTNQVNQTHSD